MPDQQLSKDLSSFVAFALAIKPETVLHRHCDKDPLRGNSVKIAFRDRGALRNGEADTLEALLKRYEPLAATLAIGNHPDDKPGFEIETCAPRLEFHPGVKYELVSINAGQLSLAKRVAQIAEACRDAHHAGRNGEARASYDELIRLIEAQRQVLVGDFANIDRVANVVGIHGVGQNGNPAADGDCGGAVIFVIIEIFVCFAPDREFGIPVAAGRVE